jgi:hypothetical protein
MPVPEQEEWQCINATDCPRGADDLGGDPMPTGSNTMRMKVSPMADSFS